MNVGTAKPTPEELQAIPHHGIDLIDPDAYFSAGEYANKAREEIKNIHSQGKLPIVVGGSGLYIKALVDGIFEGNYRDANIRKKLMDLHEQNGEDGLYQKLKNEDPEAASTLHPNDIKRIIRALEVLEISGESILKIQKEQTIPADFNPIFIGLLWERPLLYDRINLRVDQMMNLGLVNEVRKLLDMGYSLKNNALDSVGYKELINYFEGHCSLNDAISEIKKNTRRFAKRQMTWFKKNKRIHWEKVDNNSNFDTLAESIIKHQELNKYARTA